MCGEVKVGGRVCENEFGIGLVISASNIFGSAIFPSFRPRSPWCGVVRRQKVTRATIEGEIRLSYKARCSGARASVSHVYGGGTNEVEGAGCRITC